MAQWEKFRQRLLSGQADKNIRFSDLCSYLRRLGFAERIEGDHHIFTRDDVVEIINLQPLPGDLTKAYQVRQVRRLIIQYGLGEE